MKSEKCLSWHQMGRMVVDIGQFISIRKIILNKLMKSIQIKSKALEIHLRVERQLKSSIINTKSCRRHHNLRKLSNRIQSKLCLIKKNGTKDSWQRCVVREERISMKRRNLRLYLRVGK